jgi:hypothetical protein
MLLDPDSFLTQLTKSLEKSRSSGTIYVTFKRCKSPPLRTRSSKLSRFSLRGVPHLVRRHSWRENRGEGYARGTRQCGLPRSRRLRHEKVFVHDHRQGTSAVHAVVRQHPEGLARLAQKARKEEGRQKGWHEQWQGYRHLMRGGLCPRPWSHVYVAVRPRALWLSARPLGDPGRELRSLSACSACGESSCGDTRASAAPGSGVKRVSCD